MRVAAALLLTSVGAVVGAVYPSSIVIGLTVCVITAVLLSWTAMLNPSIVALRHAALGASATAFVGTIVATLMLYGDLPFEARQWLRGLVLAAVTFPALYWLILLGTGGFDDNG